MSGTSNRMSGTINLAGDKWDTIASKVVDAAELDDMRGSVIANLCDEIAAALRDAFASGDEQATLAERARCVRIAPEIWAAIVFECFARSKQPEIWKAWADLHPDQKDALDQDAERIIAAAIEKDTSFSIEAGEEG